MGSRESSEPTVGKKATCHSLLTEACADDMLSAFGLGGARRGRWLLESLARVPARRLARRVEVYDRIVGESGLAKGGAWILERMANRLEVEGRENVPREGPLLLVANHPGLGDAVALFAATPRPDLRVVAAKRPLLDALPNTSQYLFTVPEAPHNGRLGLVRAASRHLRDGGALLTFPGGRIEPDPAVLPGATKALELWSGSADFFARLVPGLTVVPAVVGGVLSPVALRNPLTLLRRRTEDRRWLSATLQVLAPALHGVAPSVEFGRPIQADAEAPVSQAVVAEMRRLIEHCETG